MLNFDHNATHPVSVTARETWLEAIEKYPGNPSSPHRLGSRADAALENAREQLATLLGCPATEIVWTSGATEANNMALHFLSTRSAPGEAWVSAIEHPSVLRAARHFFADRLQLIPVDAEGVTDLDWLEKGLRQSRPAAVAMMAANNETGVLQPWQTAAALCRSAGVAFLCDASQWIGRCVADGLGRAGLVSGCAHKFGGLPGVGFLKCPPQTLPLLRGGSQEDGRRAGTENVAAILASVAALAQRAGQLAMAGAPSDGTLRDQFIARLKSPLPGIRVLGENVSRLWNTVSVIMPEIDCRQRWVVKLDKLGVAVSTGSACASGREVPSHVLQAMGLPPAEAARVLRISSGWETSPADWEILLERVQQAARELNV